MNTAAVLLLACALYSTEAPAAAAVQTIDARELVSRLQRVERDLRDLQSETFRRPPGAAAAAAPAVAPAPTPAPPPPPAPPLIEVAPPAMPDLNPLMRRMTDIEDGLGRLTGQMEELGHQLDLLSLKTDRMQKQMEFDAAQPRALSPAQPAATNGGDAPTALATLTPEPNAAGARAAGAPPAVLGQIPAGSTLPTARASDPKRDYDAAMGLLSRAQYDQASQAFRAFAAAYPNEDRVADALYWTGDIAYSTKKDYDTAARDFADLLKRFPKAQRAPDGMLKLSLSLFELGQMKEGCAALAALPAKYPDAPANVATRARSERRDRMCR